MLHSCIMAACGRHLFHDLTPMLHSRIMAACGGHLFHDLTPRPEKYQTGGHCRLAPFKDSWQRPDVCFQLNPPTQVASYKVCLSWTHSHPGSVVAQAGFF